MFDLSCQFVVLVLWLFSNDDIDIQSLASQGEKGGGMEAELDTGKKQQHDVHKKEIRNKVFKFLRRSTSSIQSRERLVTAWGLLHQLLLPTSSRGKFSHFSHMD